MEANFEQYSEALPRSRVPCPNCKKTVEIPAASIEISIKEGDDRGHYEFTCLCCSYRQCQEAPRGTIEVLAESITFARKRNNATVNREAAVLDREKLIEDFLSSTE